MIMTFGQVETAQDFGLLLANYALIIAVLSPVLLAIVAALGRAGLSGRAQFIGSLVVGLVLGGAIRYGFVMPTTYLGWLDVALFGLLAGLTASGVYDTGKGMVARGMVQASRGLAAPYEIEVKKK